MRSLKILKKYLTNLELAKNVDKLVQDGWKQRFTINVVDNKTNFEIISKSLDEYNAKHTPK